jgi:transposase
MGCHCLPLYVRQYKSIQPKNRSCRTLTPEQEKQIQRLISDKRPEQLKLDFTLWTRAAVMLLIEGEYGLCLPVRSVGEYLKRWGFTPQKPVCRAYEQSPVALQKWLDETYPEIFPWMVQRV